MKKIYAKPKVSFESFAFSSNIAAGCSAVPGLHGENCASFGNQSSPEAGCQFFSGNVVIFTENLCTKTPQEDNKHDLCYHGSTDATRMFMS